MGLNDALVGLRGNLTFFDMKQIVWFLVVMLKTCAYTLYILDIKEWLQYSSLLCFSYANEYLAIRAIWRVKFS